jgi:SpoVK/Ycf46/Vps4 family AAA+-type ATPase
MLWHGAPGTGKTTAIRALARAWRSWADFQFITDPECFLQMPSYLLGALANDRRLPARSQWRVLVLEDSGEFLAPDAKVIAGQGISRLLNVCDGVLGQATQSLILVTTNEHLRTLHPALSRPGRCLSQVEFHELNAGEIEAWCRSHEIEPPPHRSAALAELFAHAGGRSHVGSHHTFGFVDAA